jgi:viroplasmin and RNaseH domain-containing protein
MTRTVYAVHKGNTIGIFNTWEDTQPIVNKFPGAQYRKFEGKSDVIMELASNYVKYGMVCNVTKYTIITSQKNNKVYIKDIESKFCIVKDIKSKTLKESNKAFSVVYGVVKLLGDKLKDKHITDIETIFVIYINNIYAYNILTKYAKLWQSEKWHKTNGQPPDCIPLLKLLCNQLMVANTEFHQVPYDHP